MSKKEEVSKQFLDALEFRGIKRRDFLKYCGATAVLLGLSESFGPKIAAAVEKATKRTPVIWLNFASDSGCTESFIKATYPRSRRTSSLTFSASITMKPLWSVSICNC